MNIYQLLREIIYGLAKVGGMSSEKLFDAYELIDSLEKAGVFGSVAIGTQGKHEFRAANVMMRNEYAICAFCHKPWKECEGTKE